LLFLFWTVYNIRVFAFVQFKYFALLAYDDDDDDVDDDEDDDADNSDTIFMGS